MELEHPQPYDPIVEISHHDLNLTDAERAVIADYVDGVEHH